MMYALQCMTGSELDILGRIQSLGFSASVPVAIRLERSGGQWRERPKVIMPSYVFVDQPIDDDVYHAVAAVPGVIHWLNPGRPVSLADAEAAFIHRLANEGQPLAPSLIQVNRDTGRLHVLAGPLRGMDDQILWIDRHRRRVTFRLELLDKEHFIELAAVFNGFEA